MSKQSHKMSVDDAEEAVEEETVENESRGVPIGNYLSQFFANLVLAYFDHWLKEVMQVKYYWRYADDIVILSDSKEFLHNLLHEIRAYFATLELTVKRIIRFSRLKAVELTSWVMCSIIPTHACARASSKGCAAGWRILTSARSSCPKLPIDSRFAVGGVGVNTAIQ